MEAFLDLVASGRVVTEPLVSHRFPVQCAAEAYQLGDEHPEQTVQVLLTYAGPAAGA